MENFFFLYITDSFIRSNATFIAGYIIIAVRLLFFRCSALATPPEEPPAKKLHMTYKIFQTDTKLINLLLQSHGLAEVSKQV